ncbi:signal transducer and activator of transcription 5B-like [Corticium candelabrum]|uniref:signal transducer and activator of transcription 5B-like n=1 Tax=Corticium candelabrum TaxID=121492 RepID=UPI002E262C27|nr:signal transducer and activator of transcription 5B-like [Corticium candelabrum]
MTLWGRTQQLDSAVLRQINSLYGPHFPIEVRHYFAAWIESQPWDQIDPDNPTQSSHAKVLVETLINRLEAKAQDLAQQGREDTFLLRLRFEEIAQHFQMIYLRDPLALVRVVRHCLQTESQLVEQSTPGSQGASQYADVAAAHQQVAKSFDELVWMAQETEADLKQLQQAQEYFVIQYQEMCKLQAMVQRAQSHPDESVRQQHEMYAKKKTDMEVYLSKEAENLLAKRNLLVDKFQKSLQRLAAVQRVILDEELMKWRQAQQLANSGGPPPGALDVLQSWCEGLAELIWRNRQQIRQIEMLKAQLPIQGHGGVLLEELTQNVSSLLSTLVTSTFIIEKQPPQVLKTQTKFVASVRLLVGGKLNVHMNPPEVIASIVNEKQARALLSSEVDPTHDALQTSGDIINNRRVMEYHQASGSLSVTFRNMQLKKIKRPDKKGAETAVTEEKFTILFTSRFSIGTGELLFAVRSVSLPVVVVVHGNQVQNAEATILWDNFFSEPGRVPFFVPDHVTWKHVASALNARFVMSNVRELTDDNLEYLSHKCLHSSPPGDDQATRIVTWQSFNKDPLPGRNFTFWEWFFGILDLVRRHLLGPWQDGLIMGFVTKQQAQELLQTRPPGTFLLRFSDSEVGGVTVAWVAENDQGELQVWNLQPWWAKDFSIRALADRIHDLPQLRYLYPDIPKDKAFGQYYSPIHDGNPQKSSGDYVQSTIAAVIPASVASASEGHGGSSTNLEPMKTEGGPMRHSAEMTSVFFSDPALSPQGSSVHSPENASNMATDMEAPVDLSQLGLSSVSNDMDMNEFLATLQKN